MIIGNKGKGKILSITQNGSFDSGDNTKYNQEVHLKLDDGEMVVQANSMNPEPPYKVGDEIEWECWGDYQGTPKCSIKKPNNFKGKGGGNGQPKDTDAILYQVCLKGVMDYYTKSYDPQYDSKAFTSEKINELALEIAKGAKANINLLKQSQ